MSDKIVFRAENGTKTLARNGLLIFFSVIYFWAWSFAPLIFTAYLLFNLNQIIFFRFSTLIVHNDKIKYELKNSLNLNSLELELEFKLLIELSYSKSEIEYSPYGLQLINILFPAKENAVIVCYNNGQKQTLYWRGNSLDIQFACENTNEIIHLEFNRPRI